MTNVIRETDQAVTLELADERGERLHYQAGQFFSVGVQVGSETLWRAYSLSSAPHEATAAITIKRVPDGRVSNRLCDTAAPGMMLNVRGPSGRFVLPPATGPRHVVLIGGGSGITPLMGHLKTLLHSEPETTVTLIYGNRRHADIIFRDALAHLAREHEPRLKLRHVLEEPSEGFEAGEGQLDREATERELTALGIEDKANTLYLVCGPELMIDAVREALAARGVADARVLMERFATPPSRAASSVSPLSREELVSLRVGSRLVRVPVKAGQSILEAGLAAGLPLEFSCTMGGCGACMLQLTEGQVTMDEPNCLSERERAENKVLACIARPCGPCTLEKI